jgi:hypothetical protein
MNCPLPNDQQELSDDFAPGELNSLLADGEESIAKEGTSGGDESYWLRCKRLASLRVGSLQASEY